MNDVDFQKFVDSLFQRARQARSVALSLLVEDTWENPLPVLQVLQDSRYSPELRILVFDFLLNQELISPDGPYTEVVEPLASLVVSDPHARHSVIIVLQYLHPRSPEAYSRLYWKADRETQQWMSRILGEPYAPVPSDSSP